MSQATLLVIEGVDQGARFEIGEGDVGMGRDPHNAVRLLDTEVSRSHARVHVAAGRFVLHDLHSSNGTYVNGRLVERHELAGGDEIQVGRTVLLFAHAFVRNESQLVADHVSLTSGDEGERSAIVGSADATELLPLDELAAATPRVQALANLQMLYRIAEETVRPSNSVDQLLSRVLELTLELAGADRGCILLRDTVSGQTAPQVFRHRRGLKSTERMPVSRSIVDYVLAKRQGVRTSDARNDLRFAPGQSILQAGIREAICVPMQGRYDLQGAMYIDMTTPPERVILQGGSSERFNEELLRLMVAVGRQTALAVEDNRYHQAMLKAEKLAAVGQTIAMLSHHIKNILQGVRGGSYLIDLGLKDENNSLVRKGWQIVDKNQQKIYHLVMDMLTFSKERQPQTERADLNETVAEICELLQSRAEELGVRLEWRPAADLPAAVFDREGIHRAVLNVALNALDAVEGRDQGAVVVETGFEPESRFVCVSVADNGPGVPPDKLASIFNLFESTKGARGTGIGLAVSQKIIREHGGDIEVVNTPGAGARFTLGWPLVEELPAPAAAETP